MFECASKLMVFGFDDGEERQRHGKAVCDCEEEMRRGARRGNYQIRLSVIPCTAECSVCAVCALQVQVQVQVASTTNGVRQERPTARQQAVSWVTTRKQARFVVSVRLVLRRTKYQQQTISEISRKQSQGLWACRSGASDQQGLEAERGR